MIEKLRMKIKIGKVDVIGRLVIKMRMKIKEMIKKIG